ncbi:MAG: MMPL family protein, partial [Desulfobacterales bacterium]|nr:MMPL family protein [Desulfobacterales bacterium]
MNLNVIHWKPAAALVAAALILLGVGVHRIEIDADITKSLPSGDPVLEDARRLLERHPLQDRVVMDLGVDGEADPDLLVEAGAFIEGELRESGLFRTVGMDAMAHLMPGLMMHVADNLPVLFSSDELAEKIAPLLTPEAIRERLRGAMDRLGRLDGIGQVRLLEADPLEFRNIVLARLASLSPSSNARIYRGRLLSADGRHLLILAHPLGSGSDTVLAGRIAGLLEEVSAGVDQKFAQTGRTLALTPMGAYRAALDNERTAKADTQRAILFSFIGVALLLILAFPRPLLGLLALVPAMAGTVMAFFVFSLIYEKVSILAIGFGGAIISITVDHGIAFLMFLDRPHETKGKQAAREVWAVGLLAALTSVGAFSFLTFSGFHILAQIGLFAALGIAFAFIFVHAFFPMIFPAVPPASASRPLPLRTAVDKFAMAGGKYKAWAALGLALFFLPFARPVFHVDLRSMNTVSPGTKAAESLVSRTWGNVFSRVFMMIEADGMAALRERGDRITARIETDLESGVLTSAFAPSMVFPGPGRAARDHEAWKAFWSRERAAAFKERLREISTGQGFAKDAFAPFLQKLEAAAPGAAEIPGDFFPLLGMSRGADGAGWIQFSTLTPGPAYDAGRFYARHTGIDGVRVFDPRYFSERLGDHLSGAFIKMACVLAPMAALLLLIFFVDVKLTLIAL